MPEYQKQRMEICNSCERVNQTIKVCTLCGCFMPAKTLIKSTYCPDTPPRWTVIKD